MEFKHRLHLDFETKSDIDIVKCGMYRYMESEAFEHLLLAWAVDDEPTQLVDFTAGEDYPSAFKLLLKDPTVLKIARNAGFERNVLRHDLGEYQDPRYWLDTAVLAASCGLPRSLEGSGAALALSEDQAKIKDGKALIRYFCCPVSEKQHEKLGRWFHVPEDAPDRWARFCEYCVRDVDTDRLQYRMLEPWIPNDAEHRFWCLDTKINEAGVRIDRQMVINAIAMDRKQKEPLFAEARRISGIENPKSVPQVKAWLEEVEGIRVASLNKDSLPDLLPQLKTEKARRFMELRSDLTKTSTSKYEAMLRGLCEDGTVKGCFLFYGASRTGRFAGRQVQFQNLPRNEMDSLDAARRLVVGGHYSAITTLYDSLADTLKQLIRTTIIPYEGQKVLVSDFSAIEARVIAWIAGEDWRLDVFREGGDIYCASASKMFHVPVVKHGLNGHLRAKGKVAELALGYGGGPAALLAFGADKLGMTDDEMQETVDQWREASPRICALWRSLEKSAIKAITSKGSAVSKIGGIRFDYERGILWATLPSGRRIAYFGARYAPSESKFKRGQMTISYMGMSGDEDSSGKRKQGNKWVRLETWGGKITENVVQATARDCLREAMFNLEDAGYDMRAHVHDEVIVYEPIGGRSVEEMSELMGRPISWAPGLPLRADGYETPYYKKD